MWGIRTLTSSSSARFVSECARSRTRAHVAARTGSDCSTRSCRSGDSSCRACRPTSTVLSIRRDSRLTLVEVPDLTGVHQHTGRCSARPCSSRPATSRVAGAGCSCCFRGGDASCSIASGPTGLHVLHTEAVGAGRPMVSAAAAAFHGLVIWIAFGRGGSCTAGAGWTARRCAAPAVQHRWTSESS